MDKKRAAIVTSAGVGLLVSAIVLRKLTRKRKAESASNEARAVVHSEDRTPNPTPDAV